MMTTDNTKRGKLKITQERVVKNILFAIKTDGSEKGKLLFDMMNSYFSTEPGWPETAMEVRTLFAEMREKEEREILAEKEAKWKLEEMKVSNPSTLIYNTNDAKNIGKAEIDKMSVDVNSPGNNIARTIKLEKKYDE